MRSLMPHLVEESYEALDALEVLNSALEAGGELEAPYAHLQEELGDLVFQVVFHARLADEEGRFDLADVLDGVRTSWCTATPTSSATSTPRPLTSWPRTGRRSRRAEKGRSVTEGIPAGLPALMRHTKLRRKATAVGLEPEPSPRASSSASWRALDGRARRCRPPASRRRRGFLRRALARCGRRAARRRGRAGATPRRGPGAGAARPGDALRAEILAAEGVRPERGATMHRG